MNIFVQKWFHLNSIHLWKVDERKSSFEINNNFDHIISIYMNISTWIYKKELEFTVLYLKHSILISIWFDTRINLKEFHNRLIVFSFRSDLSSASINSKRMSWIVLQCTIYFRNLSKFIFPIKSIHFVWHKLTIALTIILYPYMVKLCACQSSILAVIFWWQNVFLPNIFTPIESMWFLCVIWLITSAFFISFPDKTAILFVWLYAKKYACGIYNATTSSTSTLSH